MQFKQYPSYKPSGVEWLGDVPEHWQQKPIWSLFKRIKRTNFPTERLLSVYRDYGVIPKDSRDDNHNRASEDLTPYQLVCANDLVINKMKAWQGSIAISELRGIVSPAYYIYQPKAEYHSKYIHFLIRSAYYIQSYKNYSKGIRVNQWDLESEAFTHIDLLLPSLDEQQKIVAFLDTETTRIDNLIAKQEKLIELLEEQRKSIISHAVTKGLNPNAPMKDSGVEWLGDVPEHWEVVKSKRLFWCKGGFAFSSDDFFEEGNYPVIRISNIQDKSISTDKMVYVNSCTKKVFNQFSAYTGDLIFCMTGASLGKVGLLPKELSFALINQRVGRLDITSYAIKQFVFYLVSSHGFQTNIRMLGVGLTDNFPNISSDLIGIVDVVLPPLVEQQGIVNHLEIENSKIDTLIEKQNQLIDKLKEYRASIISHAVTGKIDVREFGA
ncbi:restriction endonuclease subunit S [Acinetobacter rudis]|uniref:restriction endonuclease subunit S n=1 Tax=Acinetobacter rudis TaxID=632955 RepID=UPI00280CBD4B|nr:restriction endonuclease subunit S [Acinetobacter rudis]MDQ8954562.1 restriction endonuclease subunit S [Acinetobacter rudis]